LLLLPFSEATAGGDFLFGYTGDLLTNGALVSFFFSVLLSEAELLLLEISSLAFSKY
jgi:hypothetical protein